MARPGPDSSARLRRGELLGFLVPYMRTERTRLLVILTTIVLGVGAGAGVPLLVEAALDDLQVNLVLALILLMCASFAALYVCQRLAYVVAAATAVSLADGVYAATLESPMLRQQGLRRPSVVSRHTSDIDRIEDAVDMTLADGIPAILRIVVSLSLLCVVVPSAGLILIVAVIAFAVLYQRIGRGLLSVDRRRLDASSDVSALIDESITSARTVTGMNLGGWMRQRLRFRADLLRGDTIIQRRQIRRLVNAARAIGFIALVSVVLRGVLGGADEAGSVAAALLYINEVVRGLEQLPPWLRSVRLATTSKRRIERITTAAPRVTRDAPRPGTGSGLVTSDLRLTPSAAVIAGEVPLPREGVVALVADLGMSTTRALEVLGGDSDPDGGAVALDGVDVRTPMVKSRILLVANLPDLMDASISEHLRAVDPVLSSHGVHELLDRLGIGHLAEQPGLDVRLGTHGALLAVHERQRLLLAMATASRADIVLLESLPQLSDPDVGLPILRAISGPRRRPVIVATRSAEVAQRADHVIAVSEDRLLVGTHADLVADPHYIQLWERQDGASADARILESLPASQRASVRSRLVTEQFSAGDTLFRAGAPVDRVLYVLTGRVEVLTADGGGADRRVAEIGPGYFCHPIEHLGGRHTTTVRAVTDCLVRTVSLESWSAGLLGVLGGDPTERRLMVAIMRAAEPTRETVLSAFDTDERPHASDTLSSMIRRGDVREDGSRLHVVAQRRRRASALLDRLAGG